MSRKPIHLEIKGLQTPRERVWEAILKLSAKSGARLNRMQIQDVCEPMVLLSVVKDYTEDLFKAGYLQRVEGTGGKKGSVQTALEFTVVKRPAEAPRLSHATGAKVSQGSGNEAMWRAMKILPTVDHRDIAKAATLGDLVVKPETAKQYVNQLSRAGYLATVRASKPGTPARMRLVNNTGMYAPAITRMKVVFDRNTGKFAELQTPQEVCDSLEGSV